MRRKEEIQNSLCVLIESYFEQKRPQNYQEFKLTIQRNLISDNQFAKVVEEATENLRNKNSLKKCLNIVSRGETSFVCEDCSIDPDSSLICRSCFHSEHHLGHKVNYSTQYEGVCDCGDPNALKTQCPNHILKEEEPKKGDAINEPPKGVNQEQPNDEIVKCGVSKPSEFQPIINSFLSNFRIVVIQLLSSLIERGYVSPHYNESVPKNLSVQRESLCIYALNVIRWLREGCMGTPSLLEIFIEILMQRVKGSEPPLKMIHNCLQLTQEKTEKDTKQQQQQSSIQSSKSCECTYLEQMLRLQSKFSDEVNEQWRHIYEQLMKYDEKWSKYMVECFAKLFKFFFFEINEGSSCRGLVKIHFSRTLKIYQQFFTTNTASEWIKNEYFPHIYEQLQEIIRNYFLGESRLAFNAFNEVKNMLAFILSKRHLVEIMDLKLLIGQLVVCTFVTHVHKSPELSDEIEKMRLVIECGMLILFKKIWSRIYEFFEQDKKTRCQFLDFALESIFFETKKLHQFQSCSSPQEGSAKNKKETEWPVHFTGFRMLSIVLNLLVVETNVSTLKETLLERHFEDKHDQLEGFIGNVIQFPLRAMRFAHATEQKVGNYYQMMSDPLKSMKIEIINSFYKKSFYGQMDLDIALIQVLLAVMKERNSKMPLMNILCSIYGEIDIKQIYFSTQDEPYKHRLGAVLELIAVLAVNNASILNAVACSQILQRKNDPRRPEWLDHHLHCVLINAFHLQKVHDLRSAKDVLFDKILNYEINIDPFILDIAEPMLSSSRSLRLKVPHQRQYEPFLFHKYTRLSSSLFEKVKQLSSKHDDCDPIIGNISLYSEHSFLRTLLNNLFSDEVPRYLMLTFRIDAFNENLNDVLKFSIKLVGLYLTFCIREIIELNAFDENRQVFDHLLKYFLKPELEKKLSEMKNNRKLTDIKQTIDNIQRMITLLKEEINDLSEKQSKKKRFESISAGSDVPAVLKKQQQKQQSKEEKMKKQQEQIRMEFIRKQQQFQLKNQSILEQDTQSQGLKQEQPRIEKKNEKKQKDLKPKREKRLKGDQPVSAGLSQGDCGDSMVSWEVSESESDEDEDFESGEDEECYNDGDAVCSYCHSPVQNSEYGIYAYLSEDNLIYYCLNLNGYENSLKSDLLKQHNGYRIYTCGHFIHTECRHKLQNIDHSQALSKRVLFSSQKEHLCGQCKGLSNIFLPILLPNLIKIFSFSHLQFKISHLPKQPCNWFLNETTFEQLIKSSPQPKYSVVQENPMQNELKIVEILYDQFSQILQLDLITMSQLNISNSAYFRDDAILFIAERTITHLSDVILLAGWNHFFNKCFKLASNFFANFREFLLHFHSERRSVFIQTVKENIISTTNSLTSLPVQEVELIYFSLLWRCAILQRREKSIHFLAIFRFLSRKIFEIKVRAFFEKFMKFGNNKQTFAELLKLDTFEYELIAHILPFVKASIATLLTIFPLRESELKQFDEDNFDSDVDQYQALQKLLARINCSDIFEIKTIQCSIEVSQPENNKNHLAQLNPFKMVILPKDFLEFNRTFSLIKCSFCCDYARFGDPYLCLICEKVTCSIKCDGKHEQEEIYYSQGRDDEEDDDDDPNTYKTFLKKNRKIGNLNRHATHFHCGKTAYLNLKNGQIILINYPKNIFFGWIYSDEFGHIPNPKNNKWDKFKLNHKIANQVQEMLIQSKLPQEICYHLMQDTNILIDRDYI